MTSSHIRIQKRFNALKPYLGVQDAVCLKSFGQFSAPCGFELVPGTLIRLGTYQAEIHVDGNAMMVPTAMVCVVAAEQNRLQPPRRDEMCPTSGEKRRRTPPPGC